MSRVFLAFSFLFVFGKSFSQSDSVEKYFAFRINDYMVKLNDSVVIVQVSLPDAYPFVFKKEQLAVMKHRYENEKPFDTTMIGWGRCELIKSNYYYFTVHHTADQFPEQGDLLYAKIKVPFVYDGLLLKIGSHAINFTQVDESEFYHPVDIFSMTKEKEMEILDSMVADIQFTGKEMLQRSPQQNMDIKGGIYDGQKLFIAMQQVNRNEVEKFLKYVIVWHGKYAGNIWKISETFATWIISGTPVPKE